MKFLFGFLITLLNTPLATSFLGGGSGGSCDSPNDVDFCGTTPNGDKQYCLSKVEECDARLECIENASTPQELASCTIDFVYCTVHVDKAKQKGYECDSQVKVACSNGGGRSRPFLQSMMASFSTMLSPTMTQVSPIMAPQAAQCTTPLCGTGPDGAKQGYMLDPNDCTNLEGCQDNACQFQNLFCAEDLEIDKTLFLTEYECLGDVVRDPNTGELIIPICEA